VVGQVKIVGILMIVHGVIIFLVGGGLVAVAVAIMAMPARGGGGAEPWIVGGIYGGGRSLVALIGALHAIAGFRVMAFKNRVLGLVALFSNTLLLFTCYCAVTAIPMMIYGLIVLFQSEVGRAFEMVAAGSTPEEAIRRFTRHYGDERDDYDEMPDSRRGWEEERRRRREQDDDLRFDTDPEDHS
jgi:hypothetical protein